MFVNSINVFHCHLSGMIETTVNSEIFARILFLRIALKDIV